MGLLFAINQCNDKNITFVNTNIQSFSIIGIYHPFFQFLSHFFVNLSFQKIEKNFFFNRKSKNCKS